MRSFILKIIGVSIPVLGLIWLSFSQANGKTDPLYLRFTTPKQQSLILGTSRAAQGLLPSVLDSILDRSGTFNFAMTAMNSPYGPIYYQSVCKKLDSKSKDGLFILSVTPWSISSACANPNDSSQFRESDLALSRISNMNTKPNFEYLIHSYSQPYYQLWQPDPSPMLLHQNGWLEVTLDMQSKKVDARTKSKIDDYKTLAHTNHYSDLRFSYLKKTIDFLNQHGEVYLVRMPISQDMIAIEKELMPDFDLKMKTLAREKDMAYFDLHSNDAAVFTDGNHLEKHSAKMISELLGEMILHSQN